MENFETEAKQKWQFFIKEVQKSFTRTCVETKLTNPNLFFHTLSQVTPALTTVVIDVGQNQQWCAQSWVIKHSQRMLYSGGMGAMGFALPSAIGAWCADKKPNLVVISGDGGIQINIQELETASRHQIPMKLFIINNKSLGMVREFQDLYLNKNHQSTVNGYGNPDFKKLADAYGFEYMCISVIDSDVLADIMKKKKPIFIEVLIDITAPLQPKVVYGHALDDQAPYLQEAQKVFLEKLKGDLNVL